MDNKLNELSKPVAEIKCHEDLSLSVVNVLDGFSLGRHPVYSQEYVCALLAELDSWKRLAELRGENWEKDINNLLEARERIAELERNERHSERQNVIDGLARSGEAWADIEEYMEKWDEEHRKAIEEHSVRYQCREIGEGGWMDCDKSRYDSCQRRPEMDTRIVTSPLAELEAKDKRIAELEAKLATPVRLPETYSPEPWMGPDPSGTWLEKEDVKDSIRTAGFKVEWDE